MTKLNVDKSKTSSGAEYKEESNIRESTVESNVDTSFFYTNDKFINQLDDSNIIQSIQQKYSEINGKNQDSVIKKSLANFLDDEKFVLIVLDYYKITIFDLFKILYKQYGLIFKGPYLKKIRKIIFNKKYAKLTRRKTDY